ncbi:OmpA family protein [Marinilongibacter aquaticus]|uniref:OmpA family protein n=1 Tax=Marinilongibacter aquaticus TaxID=2975157 RepID=UPI0021BDD299|nr:OmpA family protein [Marinilongibacter aquaticus]UBM60541.1 OmpA family protein [Marinilongibacter aquaticus]
MNRAAIPIAILICSLVYCWFWNCYRKPYCEQSEYHVPANLNKPEPTVEESPEMLPDVENMTKEEQEELLFEPLDVYFETGQESISRSPEIDVFIETAKRYLAANPEKKLQLVGHTDSQGSDTTNDPLSVKRAQKMKDFLTANGFNGAQLQVSGKGEREPVASNDSPEGRAKNRRVTINLAE